MSTTAALLNKGLEATTTMQANLKASDFMYDSDLS